MIILTILVLIIIGVIFLLANPFKINPSPTVTQSGTPAQVSSGSSEVGQKVADFELGSFNGEKVKLSQFAGRPVFIDFWAAWCPFCVNEMPEIEKIHQEFGDKLVVLGIHRSETEGVDVGTKFAKERGVTYTLLKDTTGGVYKTLTGGRQFMPYALYIDKEGNIAKVKAGPKTQEEMRQAIEELLR
ncbi:TlpA family protein disulfide reductase [Candidatus Microgenomates bacterium]|nr:TlpA family protein disulfide reductase [Candidatus Microgenomates bacterium]